MVDTDIALPLSQGLPSATVFVRIPQESAPDEQLKIDELCLRVFLREADKNGATRSVGPWLSGRAISADSMASSVQSVEIRGLISRLFDFFSRPQSPLRLCGEFLFF
jgi:hypothetical protein